MDVLLTSYEIEKARHPNAFGKISHFHFKCKCYVWNYCLGQTETWNFSNNISKSPPVKKNTDRRFEILNQLWLEHLNEEEIEIIHQLCSDFLAILYLDEDNLSFPTKSNIPSSQIMRNYLTLNHIATPYYINTKYVLQFRKRWNVVELLITEISTNKLQTTNIHYRLSNRDIA